MSNFLGSPVTVFQGQLLGYARSPNTWLDSSKGDPETVKKLRNHASFIKAVTEELEEKGIGATHQATIRTDEEALTGGPKIQELPPEVV